MMTNEADIIDGFPYSEPNCKGCGNPLELENAWMTDGCPCNTELGVNSMNETRWRLLMQLQQINANALVNHTPDDDVGRLLGELAEAMEIVKEFSTSYIPWSTPVLDDWQNKAKALVVRLTTNGSPGTASP